MQQNQPANFKNRIGFVLASVGSAVGMGNIWMFPYRVGQYGGAAFLLIYFGFVALFGWVGLSGEFAFGRLTGTGPIGSYAYALRSRGKKGGGVLGAIPLLGSLGIVKGRKATCYPGFEKFLDGASYTAELVTVDDNITTGKGPAASFMYGFCILEQLTSKAVAEDVKAGMLINELIALH